MKNRNWCPYCMNPLGEGQVCSVCGLTAGSYTPQSHHLPPGTVLQDRYLIGRVLGEGGFGITYIGCDLQLEVRIAIKEYFPVNRVTRNADVSLTVSRYTGTSDEDFEKDLDRFLLEARIMAKLSKNRTIVSVHDFFRANGTACIVMEYIEGTTLKDLTKQRGGRIPAWELLHLIEPLFFALQTVHEAGLIHRDISPENIMLENGVVRLLDFGCARDMNTDQTMTVLLKQDYAPPEQYLGRGQGPWTDVYALAATMYYCLTGRKPQKAMDRLVEDELILPRKLGVDLTERQEAALLHAMRVRQRQRYQSMAEFHAALYEGFENMPRPGEEFPVPEPVPDPVPDPVPEPVPDSGKSRILQTLPAKPAYLAGGAAVLVILILVIVLAVHAGRSDQTSVQTEDAEVLQEETAETEETTEAEAEENGGEEPAAEEPAAEEPAEVRTETSEAPEEAEITEETTEKPYTISSSGTVYLNDENGSEAALQMALADGEVSSVVVQTDITTLETLEIHKSVSLQAGLYAGGSVIVGEGGALTVTTGNLCVTGLLRTMNGGSIQVTMNGALTDENGFLWLESRGDLTVDARAVFSFGGYSSAEDIVEGGSSVYYMILDEDALFAGDNAVEATTEEELRAALNDENVSAVTITADITLSEHLTQTRPVRIAAGVTVAALGEDQELDADGNIVPISGDNRAEAWNWTVQGGAVLINHGTLLGDLYAEFDNETPSVIISDGTVDVSGGLDSVLLNLDGGQFNLMHGYLNGSGRVVNLGTFTHIPRLGSSLVYLYCRAHFYNSGTLTLQGTEECTAEMTMLGGEIRNTGTVEIGENAVLRNTCQIETQGTIRLTADTARLENSGYFRIQTSGAFAGLLDAGTGTWINDGVVVTDGMEESGYACPEGSEGTVLHWSWGCTDIEVSTAGELQAALDSDAAVITLNEAITWDGDLTVSGKELGGSTLTVTGSLTLSGSTANFDTLDIGDTLTLSDGAAAVLRSENGPVSCSRLVLEDASILLCTNYAYLGGGGLTIELDPTGTGGSCITCIYDVDLQGSISLSLGSTTSALTIYGTVGNYSNIQLGENRGTISLENGAIYLEGD